MNKTRKKIMAVTFMLALVGGPIASAQTSYANFSTTTGRLNGSGYTAYQKKTNASNSGDVQKFYNGGYNADIRMNSSVGSGTWRRQIGSQSTTTTIAAHSSVKSGTNVRIQVSNNLTTTVNTQSSGSWRAR
ncbi:hypothetical protein [Enterococcus sp.]|uniref:hypothetical protein n=1 Tax=Enterococcus sp. TaxID=35783 RepID=UPI0028A5B2A2|nr:hypothetical protein [Enterococcus sp.]